MQKAIEEAKKFVCTTKDRIVKDAKEFIQNVDWKKVAIGVAGTLAVAAVVVATGGAAAPVLIGAAVGAGISTGTTVVSGVIQGKSPAEIAKDASGAFMWGAIGGAVGGGTTEILKNTGTKIVSKFGKKMVEDGVDMVVDLSQTASENGKLTGKDILFSAVSSFGGDLVGAAKTNSTTRNQLIEGVPLESPKKDYNSILQDFADKADDIVEHDPLRKNKSTTVKGTYKHSELEHMIDDLDDPHLRAEVSFNKNGGAAKRGEKGSIRLDAVEYDDNEKIVNVWDLKTGEANLSDKRKQQIYNVLTEGHNTAPDFTIDSIHELRANKK